MTENEMVGGHHRLNGHKSEQAPGVGEVQGSLACCRPWGHRELDTTELSPIPITQRKAKKCGFRYEIK